MAFSSNKEDEAVTEVLVIKLGSKGSKSRRVATLGRRLRLGY